MVTKSTRIYAISLTLIAALLKLVVFLQNRSLFLDEINLSRNIVEKSYIDLFLPLDYGQFAPPLYSCTVKLFTQIFGIHEFSLRLFPFLLGLASLILFYKIVLKIFNNPIIIYPVLLFGLSIFLLRYGTENKQYACDVFFALLFICISLYQTISSIRSFVLIGIAGAIGIWFSMPLVFTLFGVGCFFLYKQFKQPVEKKWDRKKLIGIAIMIAFWLISFALIYFFSLKVSIDSKYLQDYHQHSYLQFPNSFVKFNRSWVIIKQLVSSLVGKHALLIIWALLCILIGTIKLIRNDIEKFILLLFPIGSCFIASILEKFILIPRVSLFLMPTFFILIGIGASEFYNKTMTLKGLKKYISLTIIIVAMFFTLVQRNGIIYLFKPYILEESRPLLKQIEQHPEQNIPTYVYHNAVPAFKFYTQYYEPKINLATPHVQYGVWSDQILQLANNWKLQGIQKIWIIDSHTFGDELKKLKKEISQFGNIITILEEKNSTSYLIELSE